MIDARVRDALPAILRDVARGIEAADMQRGDA
jgi:hypothetical protein